MGSTPNPSSPDATSPSAPTAAPQSRSDSSTPSQ
jgi:hypothetical protein